jgi:hypothetical protein
MEERIAAQDKCNASVWKPNDAAAFWQNASAALGKAADHTEICKFLAAARGRT